MENYKVRVNNEAESEKVQYLGEQLGYVRPEGYTSHCKKGGYVCLGFDYEGEHEDIILLIGGFKESDMSDIKDYKELTIQQLRDLVVLKRNSIDDATHTCDGKKYYLTASEFFEYINGHWENVDEYVDGCFFEPLKKKEMKEFLVNHNNEWTLQLLDAGTEENSCRVAVPDGSDIYAYFNELDKFNFYKENYYAIWQDGDYWDYDMDGYKTYCKKHGEILWQRSQQPEELPFIDDEPKGISEGLHGLAQAASELSKKMKNKSMGFGFMTLKNDEPTLNDTYAEIEQVRHSHYFKDVSDIDQMDVYEVLKRFEVTDPCLQHIVKKALCAGQRGHKDLKKDLQDILDTAVRAVDINK